MARIGVEKEIGRVIVASLLALALAFSAEAAVWQPTDGAVKNFLDTANWDVSAPPTNGEAMTFGPLAAMPTYGMVGQTVLTEARLENGGGFKAGLNWTFGAITDTEEYPSRRSWKLASATGTANAAPRTFNVNLSDPTGYAGWWRLMYGGVTVALSDYGDSTALATVSTEGSATIKVPTAGTTARIGDYASGGTLAKTGAGTLEIGLVSGTDAIIYVKEGAINFKGRSEGAPTYAPGAVVHLDASQTNTMVFSTSGDGRQYVERWDSVAGARGYATNIMYDSSSWGGIPASHAPFISPVKANGLTLVDFGSATSAMADTLGPSYCMLTLNANPANLGQVREAFYAGYYTENNGNVLILGSGSAYHYCRTASTPLASWGGSGVLSGDIMLNGRKIAWDHPMTAAVGDSYMAMHTFSVGGLQNSHISYLASDRTYKGYTGGCRLGEVIIYTNALTRAQRAATHRYLMRKWLPREKWAEYDLDALTVASAGTPVSVSSPGGDGNGVLRVANVTAHGGTLVKTGDGTLEIGRLSPAGATISVQGGAVAFAPPPAAPDSPADEPYLWLDATQTSSLTFTNETGSVDYVGRWADRRAEYAATRYVAPPASGSDVPPNAPYMAYGAQNGLAAVSFGHSNALKGGDSSWVQLSSGVSTYDGFMAVKVYSTTTYGVNLFDSQNGLEFLRSASTVLLSETYAYMRGRNARWSVDGAVTDPVRSGSFRNDGVYHIVHFSSSEPIGVAALAKDRLLQGSQWGQLEIGEVLLYNRRLDPAERDRTERYLMRRWLEPARCKDIDNLTVSGKLALGGGASAASAALTGDLTLAAGATVTCNVFTNGTCDSMTLAGNLTFGGAVRLQYKAPGASRPARGNYTLFTADSITGFDASAWTLETSGVRVRPAYVSCDGHSVTLTVAEFGMNISFK